MPINEIIKWNNLSDPDIVKQLGEKLKLIRLKKNITQDELAKLSGLNRATISQLENGRAATLLTLVQVLRALNKLDVLNTFSEETEISPLQMAKLKTQSRQRASNKKAEKKNEEESEW